MSGTLDGWKAPAQASSPASGEPGAFRTFLRSPIDPATWRALWAIFLGLLVAVLALSALSACFSVGGGLLIWLVGFPIVGLGIEAARLAAGAERRRMEIVDPRPLLPHPYRPLVGLPARPYGAWLRAWAEAEFLDEARWRDVVYVLVVCPLAIFELSLVLALGTAAVALILSPLIVAGLRSAVAPAVIDIPPAGSAMLAAAVLAGLVLVPVTALTARGVMVLHRTIVEALLCVSPAEALRRDVARLRGSRSAALELEASELRRIERDLHDGAQQRLVALAIDLGRAEERIDTDPAAAKVLVQTARGQAQQALAELRGLVRGTAPAILVDRGLVAAIGAVAGGCPVPASVDSGLSPGERLPAAIERAAYFVVAEALANVAKHSGASRCEVTVRRAVSAAAGDRLTIEVRDDGAGGATMVPGGGLTGLRDRVEAVDGTIELSSPPGGPTTVRVELPVPAAGAAWSGPGTP